MKRIFTFIIATLMSTGMFAVEPTYEYYNWSSETEARAVAGNHNGIVVSHTGLTGFGNLLGHWYLMNNQNLKNSDSEWKYFGVSASSPIDSIAILYCPSTNNKTNIAWVAWGKDVTPNKDVLAHGETAGTQSSKSWNSAIWETIDLSAVEAYTVYTSRSVREFREDNTTMSFFGDGQTFYIFGIKVWLKESNTIISPLENAQTNHAQAAKANKFFRNGKLFIEKNGEVYTLTGAKVK